MIVHAPAPARYGYRVVIQGAVIPVADLAAAARHLARAHAERLRVEVEARVTLTRERPLTAAEAATLIEQTTALLAG